MNLHQPQSPCALLGALSYPGRGIVMGVSPDGARGVCAYFIMGRSANSKNRVLRVEDGALVTRPFDPSLVRDPNLIIYTALRVPDSKLILTNGDQTDTLCEGLRRGLNPVDALKTRRFEPDAPIYTPRISGVMDLGPSPGSFCLSILKNPDGSGGRCARYHFDYEPTPGEGRLIHTYQGALEEPAPFDGEPRAVLIDNDADDFTQKLWNALDARTRIALYVRYTSFDSGRYEQRLINTLEENA